MKPWSDMTPREWDAMVAQHVFSGRLVLASPNTTGIPHYSTDWGCCRLVEDEIERRGIWVSYARSLQAIVWDTGYSEHDYPDEAAWRLIRATPEQRCRAALRAMGIEA